MWRHARPNASPPRCNIADRLESAAPCPRGRAGPKARSTPPAHRTAPSTGAARLGIRRVLRLVKLSSQGHLTPPNREILARATRRSLRAASCDHAARCRARPDRSRSDPPGCRYECHFRGISVRTALTPSRAATPLHPRRSPWIGMHTSLPYPRQGKKLLARPHESEGAAHSAASSSNQKVSGRYMPNWAPGSQLKTASSGTLRRSSSATTGCGTPAMMPIVYTPSL